MFDSARIFAKAFKLARLENVQKNARELQLLQIPFSKLTFPFHWEIFSKAF